jgi:hypothetical protein
VALDRVLDATDVVTHHAEIVNDVYELRAARNFADRP